MAQNFHKMVNFKIKTNAENKIVKKILFWRKNSFDEDILIENGLQNIEMRKLLNCQCQCDNHEERLLYNDCVHCLTLIYNTIFKECKNVPYDYKKYNSKRKMSLVQWRYYKSKEKKKGS